MSNLLGLFCCTTSLRNNSYSCSCRYYEESNGELKKYVKRDFGSRKQHGEFGCPLNSVAEGLFFVCNDEEGMGLPINMSPFGDVRLMKPIEDMSYEDFNLYFADFYCVSVRKRHYVVIAAARINSDEDYFCKKYLIPINKYDNPYFILIDDNAAECLNDVWVYLFHMENIQLLTDLKTVGYCDFIEEHFIYVQHIRSKHGNYTNRKGQRVRSYRRKQCEHCPVCSLNNENKSQRSHSQRRHSHQYNRKH